MYKLIILTFWMNIICFTSSAQNVGFNVSKGNSLLFFDLESKSKLSTNLGIFLNTKKNTFEISYIKSEYAYDRKITAIDQLNLNFKNQVETINLAYEIEIGSIEKVKIDLGMNFSLSKFENSSNLKNHQGINYSDYSFENLADLGYYTENNFETSLSNLNLDDLSSYPSYFYGFGPSFILSYELNKDFKFFLKSTLKKNMSDLLDNINSDNKRNISTNSYSDNQIDVIFGVKFYLSKQQSEQKEEQKDLIFSDIESANISSTQNEIGDRELTNNDSIKIINKSDNKIVDKKEYILNFFKTENETNQTDTLIPNERLEKNEINNDFEFETSIYDQDEILNAEQKIITTDQNDTTYFVIIGVFSEISNLFEYAKSNQISNQNYIAKNDLFYLYALKTTKVERAKIFRDKLKIESWILKN